MDLDVRSISMTIWRLAALIAAAMSGACTLVPFTDVVERDPEAPQARAAEKVWSDCIVSGVEFHARDPQRPRAADLATQIIAGCRASQDNVAELARAEHFTALSNGLDRMYQPARVARMLQMARAKIEGIDGIDLPKWDGRMDSMSPAELESWLQRWDDCSEAAAAFLAKGNPNDVPVELAERASWDYCGRFGHDISIKHLSTAVQFDPNAMGILVRAHELARREMLARQIAALQTR